MTAAIQIKMKDGVAIATCTGVLRISDAREGAEALWKTPGWSGHPVVWDFREAHFEMTSPDTREVAQYVLQNQPAPPPQRVAFVTGRDVDFGMGRVFEAYRDDPRTDFRVFRDYEQATRWARGQEPDGRPAKHRHFPPPGSE